MAWLCGYATIQVTFLYLTLRKYCVADTKKSKTIKNDDKFHVFYNNDVIDILTKNLLRETSKANAEGQIDYQKVTMVYNEKNVGTIEIRHDSKEHYRQAVFSLDKKPIFELLSACTTKEDWGDKVRVYGKAIKKFAKKHKKYLTE